LREVASEISTAAEAYFVYDDRDSRSPAKIFGSITKNNLNFETFGHHNYFQSFGLERKI